MVIVVCRTELVAVIRVSVRFDPLPPKTMFASGTKPDWMNGR